MLKKNSLKFALIIPALAVIFLLVSSPCFPTGTKDKPADKKGEIVIDKIAHDFGTISQNGGDVQAKFILTNKTKETIVLENVRASCGCTTPTWTKEPIKPGKKGEVIATFNPKNRPGQISKSVTITTSGNPKIITVKLTGKVE